MYPRLRAHIRSLKRGEVILSAIPDPCRLHLELIKSLAGAGPKLATETAFLFSLENAYSLAQK